jgi:hypothetical protein
MSSRSLRIARAVFDFGEPVEDDVTTAGDRKARLLGASSGSGMSGQDPPQCINRSGFSGIAAPTAICHAHAT